MSRLFRLERRCVLKPQKSNERLREEPYRYLRILYTREDKAEDDTSEHDASHSAPPELQPISMSGGDEAESGSDGEDHEAGSAPSSPRGSQEADRPEEGQLVESSDALKTETPEQQGKKKNEKKKQQRQNKPKLEKWTRKVWKKKKELDKKERDGMAQIKPSLTAAATQTLQGSADADSANMSCINCRETPRASASDETEEHTVSPVPTNADNTQQHQQQQQQQQQKQQQHNYQPFHLKKRHLDTFKFLFHFPGNKQQPAGEWPWDDIVRALEHIGFQVHSAPAGGVSHNFVPTAALAAALGLPGIQKVTFHAPHVDKLRFTEGRRFGRNLEMAYGLHPGLFTEV